MFIRIKYRFILMILLIVFLYCWILQSLFEDGRKKIVKNTINCYRNKTLHTLPDILNETPKPNRSIFFHETSCTSNENGKITIKARQACAVESAALHHPDYDIFLIYSSPGVFKFEENNESDDFLKELLSYKNIKILHVDYETYLKGTPVEDLYTSGRLAKSEFVVFHSSDVIRYASLWRYGGIYLDLDIIVLKSFESFQINFAAMEFKDSVNCAVLSFDNSLFGHNLANDCLSYIRKSFTGEEFGENGPMVITKVMQNLCDGLPDPNDTSGKVCNGFKIYPVKTFYPVDHTNWENIFTDDKTEEILSLIKNSATVHCFNHRTGSRKYSIKLNSPFRILAEEHCPKVKEKIRHFY